MRCKSGLVLLAAIVGVSCAERELSRERAANLITELDGFRRVAYFNFQTGMPLKSMFYCEKQAHVESDPVNKLLTRLGWVRYDTRDAIVGMNTKAKCPAMVLTPAGEAASARWTRARGELSAGEASWNVPIGERQLLQVTGLTAAPDESTLVEFDWTWVPNELGKTVQTSVPRARDFFDRPKRGRATCRKWDDGWRCKLGMWTGPSDAFGNLSNSWF